MASPVVRPPWTVVLRRFWRLAFRSQSAGFKVVAALSAAVLAASVGTAVVGVGTKGNANLHEANGPDSTGPSSAAGPTASASAAPKAQATTGTSGKNGAKNGSGPGGGTSGPTGCSNPAGATDHGVTATSIDVVIPIPKLGAVQQAFNFGSNFSSEDAMQSVNAYVDWINKNGGINCRQIKKITPTYDPTQDTSMRSLCKQYTVDTPAFAFIDVLGSWHDAEQLCVSQEEHTPLISPWTSTTSFLRQGAPNLWWTGPDLCNVLRNLVSWAVSSGTLTKKTKFGVVYTTSAADTQGYNECLKPALAKAGLKARDTAQLTYSTSPNQSVSQAPVYASRFHGEGITAVIPMTPFFQFVAWIQGEQAQHYTPRLLLSDYDSMFQIALGLVGESGSGNQAAPTPYTAQLQNQQGPTYFVLGNNDFAPYASSLGDTCNKIWLHYYPNDSSKGSNKNIEATGTAMTTCQNLMLFKAAATAAGNGLTRASFDANMAKLANFGGGVIPNFRFGPGDAAGPHQQRIVAVHDNTDDACPKKLDKGNQGNCWLVKSGWHEEALAAI
jgi:ABC-type branched-subunit amino acid transport system substrate-binding protein